MTISNEQELIIEGKVCPYCKNKTEYVDSSLVYGKSYGMIYLCKPCKAWVGVHKGTDKALGRLANAELRQFKKEAHKYFDMIWKTKAMSRIEAYKWLSDWLSLPAEYTHIGMFSVKTCKEVITGAKQLLNDVRRLDLDFGSKPKTEFFET